MENELSRASVLPKWQQIAISFKRRDEGGGKKEKGGGRREKGGGRREEEGGGRREEGGDEVCAVEHNIYGGHQICIIIIHSVEGGRRDGELRAGQLYWPARCSASLQKKTCSGVLRVSVQVEGRCSVIVIVKREIGLAR